MCALPGFVKVPGVGICKGIIGGMGTPLDIKTIIKNYEACIGETYPNSYRGKFIGGIGGIGGMGGIPAEPNEQKNIFSKRNIYDNTRASRML